MADHTVTKSTWVSAHLEGFHARFQRDRAQLAVALTFTALALFFSVWRGPLPFEGLIRAFARIDAMDNAWSLASQPAILRKYYGLTLAASFGLIAFLIFLALLWKRLSAAAQAMVWRMAATLACSCALCIYMSKMQWEHIAIDTLMTDPSAEPIFGHRLLFVWIAQAFHAAMPGLSYLRCYYASQAVATLLTMYVVERWSALFIGESLSWLGQVLGVVIISTCFGYRNFYDIGIVFFFTCGLLVIFRRKYWWLPLLVTVGTLNHENILLLPLTAAFLIFDKEPRRVWLPVTLLSLLGHVAVRAGLQAAIPFQHHVDWRIWSNMYKPFAAPREMAYSLMALGGWYALGLMSLSDCEPRLRRLALLFLLLVGVTFSFGLFHEPRQFDAFIPVLIALLLSSSWRRSQLRQLDEAS